MTQWLRELKLLWGTGVRFSAPRYVHSYLWLQLHGVWCPIMASSGICTHTHTHTHTHTERERERERETERDRDRDRERLFNLKRKLFCKYCVSLFYFVLFICGHVLPTCMFEHHACTCTPGGQRKTSDPLELELTRLWASTWVLRIKPRSSERAASAGNR